MVYFIILVLAVALVWNIRNNSKLKAEVATLKAEALAGIANAKAAVEAEVKKVL